MNATWHIVRKDLRRMAPSVSVLLAVSLGGSVWFRIGHPVVDPGNSGVIAEWLLLLSIWTALLTGGVVIFSFLLAGALVLDDPLVGSTPFWLTRPIGRGRMLAAKALTAALCFLVAPLVLHLPVWLSVGSTPSQFLHACGMLLAVNAVTVLVAFTMASLCRTIAAFFFTSLCVGATLLLIEALPVHGQRGVGPAPEGYVVVLFLAVFAGVLLYQWSLRRSVVAWSGLVVGLVVSAVLGLRWPGTRESFVLGLPTIAAATVHPDATLTRFDETKRNGEYLFVSTEAERDRSTVPVLAVSSTGWVTLTPTRTWGGDAVLHALGYGSERLRWQFETQRPDIGERAGFAGELETWDVRIEFDGEIPLQIGGTRRTTLGTVRIAALNWDRRVLQSIVVEERGLATALNWKEAWWRREAAGDFDGTVRLYVLADKAAKRAIAIAASEMSNGVRLDSQTVVYRTLKVPGTGDWENAVLIPVRIVCVSRAKQPLSVRGSIIQGRES